MSSTPNVIHVCNCPHKKTNKEPKKKLKKKNKKVSTKDVLKCRSNKLNHLAVHNYRCLKEIPTVPKNMGWLWTETDPKLTENVLKVWRPGAIARPTYQTMKLSRSKALLQQNNQNHIKKSFCKININNKSPLDVDCSEKTVSVVVNSPNEKTRNTEPLLINITRKSKPETAEVAEELWKIEYTPPVAWKTPEVKKKSKTVGTQSVNKDCYNNQVSKTSMNTRKQSVAGLLKTSSQPSMSTLPIAKNIKVHSIASFGNYRRIKPSLISRPSVLTIHE